MGLLLPTYNYVSGAYGVIRLRKLITCVLADSGLCTVHTIAVIYTSARVCISKVSPPLRLLHNTHNAQRFMNENRMNHTYVYVQREIHRRQRTDKSDETRTHAKSRYNGTARTTTDSVNRFACL